MSAADHTPSPATDGLREAVEALRNGYAHERGGLFAGASVAADLDAVLAAHPAPPSETATEARHPSDYGTPVTHPGTREDCRACPPVSSDEDRAGA